MVEIKYLVYESLTCSLKEEYRIPGVEDAFEKDAYCMQRYHALRDAYDNLCQRLGVEDEDQDVETIIHCGMDIEKYVALRMFEYGEKWGRIQGVHGDMIWNRNAF